MGGLSLPSGTPAPRGAPSVSSNNASARAVSKAYKLTAEPGNITFARPGCHWDPVDRTCATLGNAATVFVFKLCERNPKRIKRWPYLVLPTRRTTCTKSSALEAAGQRIKLRPRPPPRSSHLES
jgi:hypothetical protein